MEAIASAVPVTRRLDFDALLAENQSMVFSIAWHFLRDHSAAEELAQDVFLALHRNLGAIESPEHAKFWLRKVTSQRCIDRTRRHWWQREVKMSDSIETASQESERDPLLSARLEKLVASLPEKLRIAVILRYQEDLEPMEIAEILKIPVRTVKGHLQRAIELLREKESRWNKS